MSISRLPTVSAARPTIEGASAARMRYEVTVKLIFSTLVSSDREMVGMAGKYMKLDRVESDPERAARITIHRRCGLEKLEYA